MKGLLKFAKFPTGIYFCEIADVKPGLTSKQEEIIIITYRVLDGARMTQTFKERLNSVSASFLKAIGEPHELNSPWDTDNWKGKTLFVDVKYSQDEAQWARYGHHADDPKEPAPPEPAAAAAGKDDDSIPF